MSVKKSAKNECSRNQQAMSVQEIGKEREFKKSAKERAFKKSARKECLRNQQGMSFLKISKEKVFKKSAKKKYL